MIAQTVISRSLAFSVKAGTQLALYKCGINELCFNVLNILARYTWPRSYSSGSINHFFVVV